MAKILLTQAAAERLKPIPGKQRIIGDLGSRGLFFVVQPSGYKWWLLRFRRGNGEGKFCAGPFDVSGRRHEGEPEVGQPLSVARARQLAAKVNADRASGRDVVADARSRKHRRRAGVVETASNSFHAVARDYITEYAKPKIRRWEETARNLGFDRNLNIMRGSVVARWADGGVKDITAGDLHAAIEESRRIGTPGITAKSEKPSEARARSFFAALSQLFSWSLRTRRIDANPMASLTPPRPPKARDRVLTDAEIKKFWVATATLTEPCGSVLRLLLVTGARLNEIAELPWSEVSDDFTTLNISGSRTKNHLPLVLVLPPSASAIIAAQERSGVYVFTANGSSPIRGWSKAKSRLDFTMATALPWRLHDLRRTCATGMASIGIAPHIVEACLNHISGAKAGVAGTYNRAQYSVEKKDALERWAGHLERIVTAAENVVPIRRGR